MVQRTQTEIIADLQRLKQAYLRGVVSAVELYRLNVIFNSLIDEIQTSSYINITVMNSMRDTANWFQQRLFWNDSHEIDHVEKLNDYARKVYSMKVNYEARANTYSGCEFAGALFTVATLGWGGPVLIGFMLAHAIDKLITHIRVACLETKIRRSNSFFDRHQKVNPVKREIYRELENNPQAGLEQSLFDVMKSQRVTRLAPARC